MRKKVTSTDIAKAAGVSQATVSMVLNKKYNVSFSRETVEKVEQVARELGYVLPKRRGTKNSKNSRGTAWKAVPRLIQEDKRNEVQALY